MSYVKGKTVRKSRPFLQPTPNRPLNPFPVELKFSRVFKTYSDSPDLIITLSITFCNKHIVTETFTFGNESS